MESERGKEEHLAYGDTVVLARPQKGAISVKAVAGATVNPDGKVEIPLGYDSPEGLIIALRAQPNKINDSKKLTNLRIFYRIA